MEQYTHLQKICSYSVRSVCLKHMKELFNLTK